jgi:hypothetical protein
MRVQMRLGDPKTLKGPLGRARLPALHQACRKSFGVSQLRVLTGSNVGHCTAAT